MFQSQCEGAPTFTAAMTTCLSSNSNINIECVLIHAVSSVPVGGSHINVSGFEQVQSN